MRGVCSTLLAFWRMQFVVLLNCVAQRGVSNVFLHGYKGVGPNIGGTSQYSAV